PLAYFAQEIGGEYVSVRQLILNNMEVHSWQPSTSDILAADEADIIIYNGANLDLWMETDILLTLGTSNKIIVETTEDVKLLETEANHEHDHDHELHDPHTWISPFIAKQQAQKIYEALVQKDPSHEEYYTERWEDLRARFEELDDDYMEGLSNTQKEAIFVTHAAFGYLAERYGFEQHGVIGISADEQPSTSVIASLVEMMIDHETYVVYVDPVYSDEYAQTLKSELESRAGHSVQILKLYFMLGPIDGMDYFEQQEKNLENLKIGLEAS
ncbi:MAG: zinc ABC transporter substrate-binding protein, partial [archaeon]|nr:zinc ABC transporter substrate-binding protein [archaeon]